MSKIVALALERYSFKPNQRSLVRADLSEDFQFRGSDLLMTHVLFNLMKNGPARHRGCAMERRTIFPSRCERGRTTTGSRSPIRARESRPRY
ncbi:MAG: hypothetical protein WDN31_08725 [Hyphomicrobium sp.]